MNDRVRFIMDDADTNHAATSRAAMRAFGMTCSQAYDAIRRQKTVICRPSQFARFLIYRSQETSARLFQAELIPAPQHELVLDVTRNA